MKDTAKMPHIHYGQEEAAELERASLSVQHIFDKTQSLLERYMPASLWSSFTGIEHDSKEQDRSNRNLNSEIFQKWVKSPKGWKCIGYERYNPHSLETEDESILHDKGLPDRILQMVIWSLFEKIQLLQPFLGEDPFFSDDEMEVISYYMVPTYLSPNPLQERGKDVRTIQTQIPLYQEHILAPSIVMQSNDVRVTGTWMTGVDLGSKGFKGLRPYLKVPKGGRTYLKAMIT